MQSSESDQILTQFKKVLRRRKSYIGLSVIAILGPVLYYNETATPMFEAGTTIVFDEFVGAAPTFSADPSREILTANRLQEIESFAFAEDIVEALPDEALHSFRMPDPRPPDFDERYFVAYVIHNAVKAFPLQNSNLVRVSVELYDPELCVLVADTAAEVYQERNYRIKEEGVSGIRRFVEEQLERFQIQLDRSEQALKSFKESNRLSAFDREAQEILRRMTEAEVLYNSAQANRQASETRLATIQANLAERKQALVPAVTDVANSWAQKLQEKLVNLQLQYTELLVQEYDPSHPKMQQLQAEIDQTKNSLREKALEIASGQGGLNPIAQIESYLAESVSLQIEIASLKAQEAALQDAIQDYDRLLSQLPEQELALARLTRERDVNQKIYSSLLEKLEESKISQAEKLPLIRILDAAVVPLEPVRPRKVLNVAMALAIGLIAGMGLGFIREGSRGAMDSTRELERLSGWPVLGAIPRIQRLPAVKLKQSGTVKRAERDSRRIKRNLISVLEPQGGPAEAYRMLRTNLHIHGLGSEFRTLLVTSVAPDAGKSTVVSNLAIAAASMGEKTLLLDAEVRRPGMHLVFDVEGTPGLVDLLNPAAASSNGAEAKKGSEGSRTATAGGTPAATATVETDNAATPSSPRIEGTAQRTRVRNLRVLSAGTIVPNTSDLLSAHEAQMRELLRQLKEQYQVIVIDGPPLALVHDAALLAKLADRVLFVVNATNCDKEMLMNCKSLLETSGAKVIGAVLNHVEPIGIYKSNKYYTSKV